MAKPRTGSVWFNRASAIAWVLFGFISFTLGLQNSVALVWLASVYANAKTDWGAAEAADDRAVLTELRDLKVMVARLTVDVSDLIAELRRLR